MIEVWSACPDEATVLAPEGDWVPTGVRCRSAGGADCAGSMVVGAYRRRRVGLLVCASTGWQPRTKVDDLPRERIGTALRQMAADLVSERRRATQLERENKRLKAQLEKLQQTDGRARTRAAAPDPGAVTGD